MRKTISGLILAAAMGLAPVAQADGLAGAYLAARSAGGSADFEVAAQYYTRALARDPSNLQLMEAAAHAQLALGEIGRAAPIARRLEGAGPSSQIGNMVLISDAAKQERYSALSTRFEEGKGVGPLVDGLVWAWALLGQGDVSGAMAQFDTVAEEASLGGFARYHKALALGSVGDYEAALAIFEAAGDNGLNRTRRGVIAEIEMLSQLERGDDALALITAQFGPELDPELRTLRDALQAGEVLRFDTIRNPKDGIAEVFYSVAAALRNEAGADYTLLYSRVTEHLRPSHTEGVLLSAGLLEDLELYDLAEETYGKIGKDNPSYHAAELGRADALRLGGKLDVAAEVLEALTKSHGDLPVVYVTLGDLRRQTKEYEAAVEAYDAALGLYGEERPNQWFVYYARAISYERLDIWDRAEADFRKALDLNPEHPQVLNYLGYSLVEKQIKLDEALSMIERAVATRPNSGYIVDSLGWVLFRLGRYEEAVPHMERAAELMPVDAIVNDHLGDVLWSVGRFREAEFQWKRALSFVDPEDTSGDIDPDRIRQKLDVGLDAVLEAEGADPLRPAD